MIVVWNRKKATKTKNTEKRETFGDEKCAHCHDYSDSCMRLQIFQHIKFCTEIYCVSIPSTMLGYLKSSNYKNTIIFTEIRIILI